MPRVWFRSGGKCTWSVALKIDLGYNSAQTLECQTGILGIIPFRATVVTRPVINASWEREGGIIIIANC